MVLVYCYFIFRKSKEEYEKEMSRRLLFEGETGATSSSGTDEPRKASDDTQITALAPSQQRNPSNPTSGNLRYETLIWAHPLIMLVFSC